MINEIRDFQTGCRRRGKRRVNPRNFFSTPAEGGGALVYLVRRGQTTHKRKKKRDKAVSFRPRIIRNTMRHTDACFG